MNTEVRLPDFDTLVALHRQDPEAFEQFRQHALQHAVNAAPLHCRPALDELVEAIDAARHRATSPEDAAVIAFRLMQGSVNQLQNSWLLAQNAIVSLQKQLDGDGLRQR